MMIDCASNPDTGFSPIIRTQNLWKTNLDYLIISHPHMDHISDIVNIDSFKPTTLLRPKIDYSTLRSGKTGYHLDVINKYISFQDTYNAPSYPPSPPSIEWSNQVEVKNYRLNGEQSDLNDYSFVTFISYGNFHYCSGGDLSSSGWERLIEQEGSEFTDLLAQVNFFHASHHGREEGFNSNIFSEMNPYLVLISDKEEQDTSVTYRYSPYCQGWNVYDENNQEWVNGRKVLTTRADGRIKISIDIVNGQTQVGVYTL